MEKWDKPSQKQSSARIFIGAEPIGCEMAPTFVRFGLEVYLVEAAHGVLPREDREAAEIIQKALVSDGVKLLCCGKNFDLAKDPPGIRMRAELHGEIYDLVIDQLLIAVGRAPNLEGLGHENVGVELDSSSTFSVELNGLSPGSGYEQLNVTGLVIFNEAVFWIPPSVSAAVNNTAFPLESAAGWRNSMSLSAGEARSCMSSPLGRTT